MLAGPLTAALLPDQVIRSTIRSIGKFVAFCGGPLRATRYSGSAGFFLGFGSTAGRISYDRSLKTASCASEMLPPLFHATSAFGRAITCELSFN